MSTLNNGFSIYTNCTLVKEHLCYKCKKKIKEYYPDKCIVCANNFCKKCVNECENCKNFYCKECQKQGYKFHKNVCIICYTNREKHGCCYLL